MSASQPVSTNDSLAQGPITVQVASPPKLHRWSLLGIMATAMVVVLPFLFWGIPSGHDFEFHFNSWVEVVTHWKQGVLYPHWAGFAHYAYGEARFLFYPPLSWLMGAVLGLVLPWSVVPAAYIWLTLGLSGCSMFLLARTWLDHRGAIFAACFYAANPYYLVIVYWRSAYAELLAGALLPLLLLLVLRSTEKNHGTTTLLMGVVVAAAWLSNAPSAVMVIYSLSLLVVVVALQRRSPGILLVGAASILLGTGLVAFYVIPAAYEQRWVDIAQVIAPGLRPQDNFLFTALREPEHDAFNRFISMVAVTEIVALAVTAVGSFLVPGRRSTCDTRWAAFYAWGGAAILMMFPITTLLWEHLPELRFVQLPWRWLLCLNAVFVPLATMTTSGFNRRWKWLSRAFLYAALLAVLTYGWHRIQAPWWDTRADLADMVESQQDSRRGNLQDGPGYEGTDEYVPLGTSPYEVSQDAPRVALQGTEAAQIQITLWNSETKTFSITAHQPGKAVLRLFNYPAWKVEINGQVAHAETRKVTGQMVLSILPGLNQVRITFVRTWDRLVGGLISLLTALGGMVWWFRERRLPQRA